MVRCKFKCEMNELLGDTSRIKLTPVFADENQENKVFFKYTPGGSIDLQVVNPDAAKQFEVGKEYYIDFTPVG